MMFNSLAFAGFLVAVFAGYWLLGGRRKAQNLFLLVASVNDDEEKWYNTRCPMIGDATLKNHRMWYSAAYPIGREHIIEVASFTTNIISWGGAEKRSHGCNIV